MQNVGSIHIWGFYDREGNLRPPQDASASEKSPYDQYTTVIANLGRTNVEIESLVVTRLISGSFVGCSFDAIVEWEDEYVKMWHVITRPQEEWPARPPATGA